MNAAGRPVHQSAARLAILVGAMIALVAITSCDGGSGSHRQSTRQRSSTGATGTLSTARPLLSFQDNAFTNSGPQPFQVSIYDLRREGPFLVLDFGLKCLNPPPTGCDAGITFTGPKLIAGSGSRDLRVPSGVWLVDPSADQEYRPVTDAQQRPFVSQLPILFQDSAAHLEWIRYAAPAPGVRSLDVVFPNGGPQIRGVPISTGPGPVAAAGVQPAQPSPFALPPGAASTAGLTLNVEDLRQTVGNKSGSDTESGHQATISLHADVLFRFARSDLTSAARSILARVAVQIRARARGLVSVTGYTDSIGTDAVNVPLSQRRAQAVVAALKPLTSAISYAAAGKGSADPVAPNTKADGSDNPAGRALNRRVTISYAVRARAKPAAPPATQPTPAGAVQGSSVSFTVGGANAVSHTWRATPTALFREGDLLVLRMTVTCVAAQPAASGVCDTETDLAGLPTVPPLSLGDLSSSYSVPFFTFSAFSLLDPATGSRYIALHSPDEYPLTAHIEVPTVKVGSSYQAWAYFPAPPSATKAINLAAPGGAQLGGVPIGSAPASP